MKLSKIRKILPVVVFIVLAVGLIAGVNLGTLSGFGPDIVSLLCPLGSLLTMISEKTLIPRAAVSFIFALVAFLIIGRAFCAWICPVGLVERIKNFFRSPKKRRALEEKKQSEILDIAQAELKCTHNCSSCGSSCAEKRAAFDSRHGVLAGALLSSAIFGFPVFCLICPIGLIFASVLLVWRLFAFGDASVTVVIVLAMLILELFVLRKWCSRFCPLSALMNLMGRFNKTFKPVIDESKCIESKTGNACSRCAMACEHGINLRHLAAGEHDLADCTRCRACVDACPTQAISMPLFAKSKPAPAETQANKEA